MLLAEQTMQGLHITSKFHVFNIYMQNLYNLGIMMYCNGKLIFKNQLFMFFVVKVTVPSCTYTNVLFPFSVTSVPAVIRFLLEKHAQFVLFGKLHQDSLEQAFARQRSVAGCNANPDSQRYSQNFRKLKILKKYAITGKCTNNESQQCYINCIILPYEIYHKDICPPHSLTFR